jgi:hypothetical protein
VLDLQRQPFPRYERSSLGRTKSALGDARGGTKGAANHNGSVNNIAGIYIPKLWF